MKNWRVVLLWIRTVHKKIFKYLKTAAAKYVTKPRLVSNKYFFFNLVNLFWSECRLALANKLTCNFLTQNYLLTYLAKYSTKLSSTSKINVYLDCKLTPKTETIGLINFFDDEHGNCSNSQSLPGIMECRGSCKSGNRFDQSKYYILPLYYLKSIEIYTFLFIVSLINV